MPDCFIRGIPTASGRNREGFVAGKGWKASLATKILVMVCGVATVSIGLFAWLTIRSERAGRVDPPTDRSVPWQSNSVAKSAASC